MTEREYWKDRILDIACSGFAIALKDGMPVRCDENLPCRECGFFPKGSGKDCDYEVRRWCEQEHGKEKSDESED